MPLTVVGGRLPKIYWSPVSSDCQVPPKWGEAANLCFENCSCLSILMTAPVAALIGQSDGKPNYCLLCHYVNACTSLGWTDLLRSGQCLWWSTFPQFQGKWKWFSLQSVRVHLRDLSLFWNYSCFVIVVQWTWWGSGRRHLYKSIFVLVYNLVMDI